MPCDTRLLTFNEMLKLATHRQETSDQRLMECRTRFESATASVRAAQERLDRAIFGEARARQAHVDWLNYLNTLPDNGSPPMREKLSDLFCASTQAALVTQSVREAFISSQKVVDEAAADFAVAQDAQRKIAEERKLITSEIAKLSSLSR